MTIDEPNWQPLEALLTPEQCRDFVFMGTVLNLDGTAIHLYKHRENKRYLNLDANGKTYEFVDFGQPYVEIERETAIARVTK